MSSDKPHKLILASKSPRRQYLLKALGFNFEVKTKDVDESFPDTLKAEEIPLYLCRKKADAFEEELDDHTTVITADTIVWVDGQVLNKPTDEQEALSMLKKLSGNRHEVYTGVCLRSKHNSESFFVRTDVYFRQHNERDLLRYIRTFKPFDKAGSYGAQESLPPDMNPCSADELRFLQSIGKLGLADESRSASTPANTVVLVDRIEGPYFNVMGLPLIELYAMLSSKFNV